eukprot:Colp12_sorted_trinity150504_noHs@14349
MDIVIYGGAGACWSCITQAKATITEMVGASYNVKVITAESVISGEWAENTALFVMPGGQDLPYCKALNGTGNEKIKSFVQNGGKYLGFCAGAYYGSARVEFEVGTKMEVVGDRELAFWPGRAVGCVYPGFDYATNRGARACKIDTSFNKTSEESKATVYYNGGCCFKSDALPPNCKVLAKYSDVDETAVILCKVGSGQALLSGVHPEFNSNLMDKSDPYLLAILPDLEAGEHTRRLFVHNLLSELGIRTVPIAWMAKEPSHVFNRLEPWMALEHMPHTCNGRTAANENVRKVRDHVISLSQFVFVCVCVYVCVHTFAWC